jgi:hypothetical protein
MCYIFPAYCITRNIVIIKGHNFIFNVKRNLDNRPFYK